MKKMIFLSAVLLLAAAALYAQENQRGRRARRQMDPSAWEKVQSELKKKDPESYEKILKLAGSNLFSAMDELRKAARKNNIAMPGGRRAGFDGGMPPPPMGFGPQNMGTRGGDEERKAALAAIKLKDPAGYSEYEAEAGKAETAEKQILTLQINAEKKLSALAAKTHATIPETHRTYMLKIKYLQEKYGRFEELDPEARTAKWKELAAKEGLMLGDMPFGRQRPFMRAGEENSEKKSASRSDPMAVIRRLRSKYPEEMQKIDELRRSDPAAANREFRKLMQKDAKN